MTEEFISITDQNGNIINQKTKAEIVASGYLWVQTGGWDGKW